MRILLWVTLALILYCNASSQDSQSPHLNDSIPSIVFFEAITKKATGLEGAVTRKSKKTLKKLIREEEKIYRRLFKIDSTAAKIIFAEATDNMIKLQAKFDQKVTGIQNELNKYLPNLDTLNTSLAFLAQGNQVLKMPSGYKDQLLASSNNLITLKGRLVQAEEFIILLKERKVSLKAIAHKYPQLRKTILRRLKKINKEAFYYSEQIYAYKDAINTPDKIEKAAIALLHKIPAFSRFIERHSQLAGLFSANSGAGFNTMVASNPVNGLQPRSLIQQALQVPFGPAGPNGGQMIQQQVGQAQEELNKLNNEFSRGKENIPTDYKPRSVRTQPFRKRIIVGSDIQFGKSVNFLPAYSDISLQIGYKLDDKRNFLISAVYKMGLGTGWNNISISHQGIGLRAHLTWLLKGQFYVQGGSEWNYRSQIHSIGQLKEVDAWKPGAVIGISRRYKISKKLKGNAQLLYDFLHKQKLPYISPVIFRIGYNL